MQCRGEDGEPDVIETELEKIMKKKKQEKEAVIKTKSEKVVQVQMNYLELLILVRRHLETGRLDLAVSFINEAINQLEKQNIHEPKNGFAGLRQDDNSPDLKIYEPLQPGD